jgi:hypothetical protein
MSSAQVSTKQTKTTKSTKTSKKDNVEVIAPNTVEVSLKQTVETKPEPKKKGKKAAKQEVVEAIVESEGEVAESSHESTQEPEETFDSFEDVFKALTETDKEITKLNRRRAQLLKILNKFHTKETKQLKKKTKAPGDNANRKKSGFNKPTKVPLAFCNYLGLDPDVELPRTNVTALLYKHIKELGMNSKDDGRVINPDDTLRKLLMMTDEEHLKFENFQHYVARVYKAENGQAETVINVKTVNVDAEAEDDEEEEDEDEEEEDEEEEDAEELEE